MLVTVMQILDTSVTNVALPHMQGSLSAGVEEMSWIITSFLAANAIIIPATGWLSGLLGRRRFFLICTVLFTVSSFLSGIAPNLTFLVFARVFQGLGGGPVIPISQAILWEIFPLRQRGMAMALWGVGIMLGPILGPTLGGWIADNWSWRWIFYINLPIGLIGFIMASAFVFDSPHQRKPGRVDVLGLALMVVGFGCLQLTLDWGEREDWFDSRLITGLAVVAACAIVGFVFRELTCAEPILDLSVFNDRNFAIASVVISLSVFVPLQTLALATVRMERLGNATAAFNVVRNAGGSVGVALATTLLARRSQAHQTTLVGHVNVWSAETAARLKGLAAQFVAQGTDTFTAERRALSTLYGDLVNQARVLAYADEFWLLSMIFFGLLAILPFMRRVRTEPAKSREGAAAERVEALPTPTD